MRNNHSSENKLNDLARDMDKLKSIDIDEYKNALDRLQQEVVSMKSTMSQQKLLTLHYHQMIILK